MTELDMRMPVTLSQGAPDSSTPGWVGQLAMDVTQPSKPVYKCVDADSEKNVYVWKPFDGVDVVQTTGERTDAVMSQSAVTKELDQLSEAIGDFASRATDVLRLNLFNESDLLKATSNNKGPWGYADGYYYGYMVSMNNIYGTNTNGLPIVGKFKANTQYTVSITGHTTDGTTTSGTGLRVKVFYTDGTEELLAGIKNSATTDETVTDSTAEGKTVQKICTTYGTQNNGVWYVKELSIFEGASNEITAIDAVARNEIGSVKTNIESVTEHTVNLFDESLCFSSTPGITYENGEYYGTAASFNGRRLVPDGSLEPGTYTLSLWLYTEGNASTSSSADGLVVFVYDNEGTEEQHFGWANSNTSWTKKTKTFTVTEKTDKLLFSYSTARENVWHVKDIQLEKGSTATAYVKPFTAIDYVARAGVESLTADVDIIKNLPYFLFRLGETPAAIPVESEALRYDNFIAQTWDTILTDYPNNVTKATIIKSTYDESRQEEFDIYKYVITPNRGYKKTVLLTAGVHGIEYEGYWGLYRLIRLILDEGYKYPALSRLKHDVRFIIIPSWNPWGIQHKARSCPLGFRADKNLNEAQEVDGITYEAFASNEAKSIKMVMDEYDDQLSLWVDFHTDPYSGTETDYKGLYGYAPANTKINEVLYDITVDFNTILNKELNFSSAPVTIYDTSNSANSGIPGYGTGRGIPSAVIEVSTKMPNFPFASGSADMMKLAEEWYGNVIANMIVVV